MEDHLSNPSYHLLFAIRRSVRYHNHRRRFYELWNSITVTVGVFGGSSAVATFFANLPPTWEWWLPGALSGAVAAWSALDLSVGTARRANLHADLGRRFIFLEQQFSCSCDLSKELIDDLTRKRLDIEAAEPPPLRLLDAMCHFELLCSMDDAKPHPRIPWLRRATANLISQSSYAHNLREQFSEKQDSGN